MMRSICKPLLVVAFLGTLVAVPALAQPSSYPAACDASKVSKGDVDRAHAVFLSGKQFLDESNYDKAISYFNDAYSIDCSVHAILPIIATAYERKGDKTEAVRALEEYLRRVPNAADREHVERRIKNLNDQLAHEAPPASSASASSATAVSAALPRRPHPTRARRPQRPWPPAARRRRPKSNRGRRPPGPGSSAVSAPRPLIGGVVLYVVGSGDISTAVERVPLAVGVLLASVASQGNDGRTLKTVERRRRRRDRGRRCGARLAPSREASELARWQCGGFVSPVLAPGYAGVAVGSSL